jgi:hypothetical protein
MKSILLASASIVAFAGAAAAEVTFSGSAKLGYNNEPIENDGFYWSAGLTVTLTQALNNGLTATAKVSVDIADDGNGTDDEDLAAGGFVLSLTSDTAGLYFGDTSTAQDKHWDGVGEMDHDAFSANDGANVLRGDIMFNGINASIGYFVADGELVQLGVGASGTFGNFTVAFAYQEEATCGDCSGDFSGDQVFGLRASTTLGGGTFAIGYAANQTDDTNSIGLSASYPVGPVTVGAYYNIESVDGTDEFGVSAAYASGPITAKLSYSSDEADGDDWGLEGTYEVGNGIKVWAGVVDSGDDMYVAATVDLGNGGQFLISYADDGDGDEGGDDDIGAPELQAGATAEVSFSF